MPYFTRNLLLESTRRDVDNRPERIISKDKVNRLPAPGRFPVIRFMPLEKEMVRVWVQLGGQRGNSSTVDTIDITEELYEKLIRSDAEKAAEAAAAEAAKVAEQARLAAAETLASGLSDEEKQELSDREAEIGQVGEGQTILPDEGAPPSLAEIESGPSDIRPDPSQDESQPQEGEPDFVPPELT